MNRAIKSLVALTLAASATMSAMAAVTAQEAAALKSTLNPLGGEKGGNKDGSIPAWTGGLTATPGTVIVGKRPDPFPADKPLYSVTAKNMAQHADKLTEATKALLQKYPDTYRVDVYPSRRTAAAPQYVYDNTFKNATRAKVVEGSAGPMASGAYAGVPFPIPKSGAEVMLNHLLRWRGESGQLDFNSYFSTPDGKRVQVIDSRIDFQFPYYDSNGSPDKFNGEYWLLRSINNGPPIRAGEAIAARYNVDESKTSFWIYLTGQRRVRKVPNACCDTPAGFSAGIVTFDESIGFTGRLDRFDWKLVGKQEMLIPYNSNRLMLPAKDLEVVGSNHLEPDHIRWELHRVWVVEATLKNGQRHASPKSRYYVDEDSWIAVLADRWDANGRLARSVFNIPIAMPDVPAQVSTIWGVNDLISGSMFVNFLQNEKKVQTRIMPPNTYKDEFFTPDALAGEGVR